MKRYVVDLDCRPDGKRPETTGLFAGQKERLQVRTDYRLYDDGKISIRRSEYVMRKSLNGGTGFYWNTVSALAVKRTKDGRPYAICQDKGKWYGGHIGLHALKYSVATAPRDDPSIEEIRNALDNASREIERTPMDVVLTDNRIWYPSSFLIARQETPADVALALYGRKNYRKDLVKAIASNKTHSGTFVITSLLRGVIPIDWAVATINSGQDVACHPVYRHDLSFYKSVPMRDLRPLVNLIDPRILRNGFRNGIDDPEKQRGFNSELADTLRAMSIYKRAGTLQEALAEEDVLNARNIHEYHDAVTGARRYMRQSRVASENVTFKHPKVSLAIHKAFDNSRFTHRLPKDSDEMQQWGQYMRNCVGSYSADVHRKRSVIGAVYLDDKMVANYEIRDGRLSQLLGKYNKPLDSGTRSDVVSLLEGVTDDKGNKIVQVASYWGDR